MENYIGTIEVIHVPEEGRRYLIHLNKPDIKVLKHIKADKKIDSLRLGKYHITEDYEYEGQ